MLSSLSSTCGGVVGAAERDSNGGPNKFAVDKSEFVSLPLRVAESLC